MIIKKVSLLDIISCLDEDIIRTHGKTENVFIDNITSSQRVNERSLDWINKAKDNKQYLAEMSPAKVLLVDEAVEYSTFIGREETKEIIDKSFETFFC